MAQIDILTGGDENLNFKPVAEDPLFDSLELTDEEKSQPNPFANLSASSAKSQVSDDLELTDSEKGLPNPFSKLPKANPKNPLQTAQEAYSIGQEQTGLDFAYRDLQLKQLYSGNKPDPQKLAQLKEASRQLQIRQYENQGNNFLTDTVYQTVQMLPPMITGAYEGVKEGGEMGLAGAAFGAAAGSTMGGVGAIPGAIIGGKAGFAVGAAKGGYDYWKGQGAGASFRELLENDVEPYAASQIAEIIGPAYAAVEYAQANSVVQVLGGKKIKSALLTGAMKVASKYLPKAVKAASSSVARGSAFVVGQSVQEGIQEAITATGTEIGKAEADLIREGASAEALDVLGKLTSESDPAKEVLGRGLLAFRESLGPMAVLGGTAKGVGAAGRGIKNIATGELRELTEKRQEIAQAGAPLTAEALANVEAGAPEIDAENIPGLEEDLEKAGIPIVSTEPQASEPKATTAGLPGDELGAKIFSNIRSRKPIAKADLDQVGGFSLSSDWKLNEETGNFEYQGPVYEAKETKKIPVQEARVASAPETEATPVETTEAQTPETQVAAPVETIKPKPSKKGAKAVAPALETKTEQPKVAPVVAAPVTAPATSETKPLPKFEDIKKNQKQIKYLRKITSEINSQVPTEDQIQPKVGWKALDYYRALTDLYGKVEKLELPKPEQQAPIAETPLSVEENKATSKRKGKVRRLAKIFSIPDLSGDQISFRDQALRLAKKISQQVASEYPNLVDGADEIYGRLVERIAARIFSSRENNRPLLFNQKGEEMEADEENIGKYVYFSARRAALDALRTQEAKKEIPTDFSGPVVAEGSVTQPEAAKEEAKPSGVQVPQAKESAPEDSRAVAELRSAASVIRERSGPEVKLVIDWIIDTMIGADTELGKIKSYKELAEYLSKVLERPVSDKRVGQFVDKTIDQIAEILNEENVRVSPEKLKMLMTPEGKAARERKAAEEANKKQERELRQVLSNLADRVRALDAGFSIKQTLIDFLPGTDTATRARITSEIIIPLEEGLIDDGQIATRLSNIQKGIENEKPRIRQPVPRSKPKLSEQTETSKVRGRARKSNDSELGGTSSNENVGGRAEPINAGDQGTSTRPSGSRSGVGEKQRETPNPVSIDPRLTSANAPKAVQAFVKAATSSGYPAKYILDENSGRPVAVLPDDVDENSAVPVIRVNPKYLAEAARRIGVGKEFATYAFLAITEEVAHHNYLLLLAKEANKLGISAQQHRKNETKRIAKIIKRRRGLKRKIEKLYNEGKPFTGVNADFRLVFEFMRMNTQNAMIGTITEALSVDVEAILREVEMGDRRFIFRFFDAIRDFLYTITGKTAAEQQFLKATADATARMSQRVSRSILRPNEAKPVSLNYSPPKKETLFENTKPVKGEAKRAREEAEKEQTGLSSASLPFLKEYAKELGIKVPLVKRKVPVFNEKTRKTEEKIFKLPFWKKAEYVKAIKEKLSELGKKPKLEDDTPTLGAALPGLLGASMPTDRPYWLRPDGVVQEVDEDAILEFTSVGGHADAALEWMRENDPKSEFLTTWSLLNPLERSDRQQLPLQEMFKRGWVRVVGDAFNLYIEGNPSQEQMTQLFETAINEEVNLIQDLSGLGGRAKSRVIYEVPEKDELGVAMPRRGFSTSEPKFSFDWRELPDNLEGLKEVETRAGTFDVRVYADEDGVKYIVKRGQSLEQFENEIAAERIYKLLNYPVAESKLITLENGETAKIAEFVYGPTLGEFEKMMGPVDSSIVEKVYEQIGDGLIIDAYLFNYDVLGQDLDNIIVGHEDVFEQDVIVTGEPSVKSHSVYRIDNGGTFDIRAQGLPKNPFFFDTFAKLQTRYPRMNLSMGQMLAQISDLVLNSDEILNSVPKRLQPIMAQRLQWMVDQFSALDTMPKNTGATDAEVTEYFNGLAKAMEAVELTRDAGGRLINAATGLPSELKVRDSRGGVIRSIPKSEFRYRLERTPQFKMWFGDWEKYPEGLGTSKILDESGEPEVQYHGTNYSNRLLSNTYKNNEGARDYQNPFWPMRAQTTGNTFRGQWTSTSRQFAENWAQANSRVEYDEQIVIPVYVKSTNPFDARNPDHIQKLKGYAQAIGQGFSLNPAAVMALENGFTDWSLFEKVDQYFQFPEPISSEDNMSESQKKAVYFGSPVYSTLEAIVNLGFDGLITTEIEGATTSDVRAVTKHLESLNEAMNAKNAEQEATIRKELEVALAEYKGKAVVNVLSWRADAIKSVMNSGKFKSVEQKNDFKPTQAAMAKASLVKKNGQTLWNEFEREGITFASYESPENLVTYSYMTANQLRTRNIGKEYISENLFYVGQRLAPGAKSTRGREDTDMLGASLPRRFGVRIKSKLVTEVYDKLKRLDYEPIPDAMTEAEAQSYLEKNGIRGSMDAALSDGSPLQHGSRELLAQKIIVALNQAYTKDKDPRILEDLLAFTDKFLEQSSGIGRALRALSFWSNLTPEGMLMLYKKKSDETNREIRDRFNVFFDRVKAELSSLPPGAIDEALSRMAGLLGKAQSAADESKKRVSEKNTMTFWEEFANQLGQSLVSNSEKQLEEAEAVAAQNAGIPFEQMTDGQKRGAKRLENAKTINQAAQEMSREIKRTFTALAKEQGRNIRDPRIVTDEAFASKTIQEQEQIHQEERENKQKQDFKSMLTRWPRALRSWETMSDAIRAKAANNPELAELFNSYLGLVLNSPFTMPQLKKYISLRGVKIEDLIRSHYEEGKLANNAYSLAKELVEEAGLGADEEEVGGVEFEKRDEDMRKEEPSKRVATVPLSERLTQAIALQIREIVEKESSAKLEKLLKRYADKTLEPSLLRFINRLVEFQALGLFSNSGAWNEFQRQEGLNKLKPEVTEKLMKIMLEANKLVGYRKDERISDALSLIASETQLSAYNFTKAWWYVSILSGFGTQAANILGNASNTMIMAIPLLGKALYRTGANQSANKAELGIMFRALQLSFMDAGNILATGRSGTRKSDPKFFGKAGTDFFEVAARNATGDTFKQKSIKISATVASSIRRAMTAVDMAFYNFNKELFLFEAGLTQAYEAGLKGEKATAAALEYTFRNSQSLSAAKAQAEQEGYTIEAPLNSRKGAMERIEQSIRIQEIVDDNTEKDNPAISAAGQISGTQMTFNEEPTGLLGTMHRMIGGFSKEHPLKSAVIVPFTRIVANVWNQGIDMTGWGVVRARGLPKIFGKHLAGKFASQFEGTADERKVQQDLTFARGALGLSSVMFSMLLDEIFCGNYEQFGFEFCINGQGPKESAQKELLKNRLGWKPNSIFVRLPNTERGTYISYTFSPAAIGLSAVGLFKDNETYDYFNEKAPTDVALAMGHRMATIMFDMNFLSSLSDIFEMLNPSEPERALAKLKSFGSRIGSAIVIPNFLRDVDQLLMSPERTAREGIFQGAFVANTPIVRQLYGKTELDMLGNPVSMQFRPMSFAKRSSLVETLIGKNALPSAPKKDKLFGVVKMTDEQYADFRITRAEELGKMLNNNETIERLQSMTSGEAQLYMSAATQRANAIAKGKLIKNSPDILDQARTEKANKLK